MKEKIIEILLSENEGVEDLASRLMVLFPTKDQISKIIWKAFEEHATLHHEGDPSDVAMVEDMASRIAEETRSPIWCMYCEKDIKPFEAIIICKECTE